MPPLPFFDTRNDLSNAFVTENAGASISIEHDLSFATLIETAAWNQTSEDRPLDVDTTGLDAYDAEFQDYASQFTNELRLVSNDTGSPLQWTAGLYYYQTNQAYDPLELHGFSLGLPPDARLQIFSRLAVRSYAAYARAPMRSRPRPTLPSACAIPRTTTAARLYPDRFSGRSGRSSSLTTRATGPSRNGRGASRAGLPLQRRPDGLCLRQSRLQSGTFNLVPFGAGGVRPEVLTAYEIGVKSEFWDNRAKLNGSVFYYDYQDAQVNTVPAPGISDIQMRRARKSTVSTWTARSCRSTPDAEGRLEPAQRALHRFSQRAVL